MALKIIKCPWCGKKARITYEENRVYQMKCYSCRNTMLHVDHSFDSAVDFFEHHANLLQAEQDGRLVVLPEPLKRAIIREGGRCFSDFTMDDINNLLEAWDSGRLVVRDEPQCTGGAAEPEWKTRFMRTFLGGR